MQQLLWQKWPQFHGWDPGSSRWSCTQSPLLSWKVRYLFHSWAFKFSEQLQPCGAATPPTLHAGYCCQKALNVLSPVLYQTLTWPEDGSCSCWLCKTLLQNLLWQSGVLLTDRQIKHYLTSCLWVGNDYASIPNSNQTSRKVNLILPCPLIYCQQIACSAALISTVVVKLYEFKFFVLEREAQMWRQYWSRYWLFEGTYKFPCCILFQHQLIHMQSQQNSCKTEWSPQNKT